jgi:hypothetical protein
MEAYRKFRLELARLESLYSASVYAYALTSDVLTQKLEAGEITAAEKFELLSAGDNRSKPVAVYPLSFVNRQLNTQAPQYLREVIFVRLISALEVFLIDLLREVFLERRDLFHSQNKIEFSQGEILSSKSITALWTKLINREVRKLQNQGITQKAKYFNSKLSIDFTQFDNYPRTLSELHDSRHLLVHRLGRTDSRYRQKYRRKNRRIQITQEYLIAAFETVSSFANQVSQEASRILAEKPEQYITEPPYKVHLVVKPLIQAARNILLPSFCFEVGEEIVMFSDLMEMTSSSDGKTEIILAGKKVDVRAYVKILRKYKRRDALKIVQCNVLKRSLPDHIVREIAKSLPSQPWEQGIHKRIAKAYNTSNSQMSATIRKILSDSELSALVGTEPKFS